MLYNQVEDMFEMFSEDGLKAGGDHGELVKYQDMSNLAGPYSDWQKALAALHCFEDILAASSSGFLVGSKLSYADLELFIRLFDVSEENKIPDWAERAKTPKLAAFAKRIEMLPRVQDYFNSDRLMPRHIPPNYAFGPGKYCPAM
eukprot:g1555.t1